MYIKILEVSSVSFVEYVQIVSTHGRLVKRPEIDPRLLARGYSEEALKQMQEKISLASSDIVSLDLEIKKGFNYEYPYFSYVLNLHDRFINSGIMPYQGAYSDQPNKIIEIFNTLDQLKFEHESKLRAEQEREAKRNKGNKKR